MERRFSFTDDRIGKLPVPTTGREWYYDSKTAGLSLMVSASGGTAFYWYRKVNGKPEKLMIGKAGELSVRQAREVADGHNFARSQGRSPAAERKAKRKETVKKASLGELWQSYRDLWLVNQKPRTLQEFDRLYKLHLTAWKARPIAGIDPADVERLKISIGEKHKVNANRVLSLLGAMYRRRGHTFGLPRGFTPTAGVDRFPEKARSRVLSTDELAKVVTAIDGDQNATARDFFKVLIYTGQRKNTVLRMAWQDLNIPGGMWRLPGEKTKNGQPLTLSLLSETVAILKARYKKNPADSPFVFPSQNFTPETVAEVRRLRDEGATTRAIAVAVGIGQTSVMRILSPKFNQRAVTPFGGVAKAWRRVIEAAGIQHATIHDIRRSYCTNMLERGVPLPLVSQAMGHRSTATTARHYSFARDKAVADAAASAMTGLLADVAAIQSNQNLERKSA